MKTDKSILEKFKVRKFDVYYHHYINADIVCIKKTLMNGEKERIFLRTSSLEYRKYINFFTQMPEDIILHFDHIFHDESIDPILYQ